MQGRLTTPAGGRIQSFPRDRWAVEFERAAQAGLGAIEWLYDTETMSVNPLASDAGVAAIGAASAHHRIAVQSLCAHYFVEHPLVRVSDAQRAERMSVLAWLLERCRLAGIRRMIIPFLDTSRIETDAEADEVVALLSRALETAGRARVEIHLESSLAPDRFARLLERLPDPNLKVTYDSGNSASLGHVPHEEFAAIGHRIGSVHIKDRLLGGPTVPLGMGNTHFPAVFECLARWGYAGDFILEAARGRPGEEVAWAARDRALVVGWLEAAGIAPASGAESHCEPDGYRKGGVS
jgi:hexulose-6-phosphate isomerase